MKYIVNHAVCNKNVKTEMTKDEYEKWVRMNAAANYGFYRIVGNPESDHFYIDFDSMWEVTIVEE